ncbi:RNase adapter RapZ [Streptomyces sp. NPDC089922]|uniref:RapZ C-terminal domain-containing protein n=1 Tax=Streptomyces sp. NPDC089922 TaxID=3155189 RepID=UPI00343A1B44
MPLSLPVEIITFGYLHGPAPEVHLSIDLRHHYRDPHAVAPEARHLTGRDEQIHRIVMDTPGIRPLIRSTASAAVAMLSGPSAAAVPLRIGSGCAGGRHRSVVVGRMLRTAIRAAAHAQGLDAAITLIHRDIERPVVAR